MKETSHDFDNVRTMLQNEDARLQKLHDIVAQAIEEERLLTSNLLNPPSETLTAGQKLSDRVAQFGGSWAFIISFFSVLLAWIAFNLFAYQSQHFDPYPFILLNLVLSCIAAIQAPIIMMSQNRKEEKDRKRAENDYLINLKAEIEIRNLHRKIDLLLEEQMRELMLIQARQLELLEQLQSNKKS